MILLDVNVLVYAHRVEFPRHGECRAFLQRLLQGTALFGVPEIVLSGFVRVATVVPYKPATTVTQALTFANQLMSSPLCMVLQPSEHHWQVFERLCRQLASKGGRGKVLHDAYLAAFAIDRGDEWVSGDADFARFPGLRWRHPWEKTVTINPP